MLETCQGSNERMGCILNSNRFYVICTNLMCKECFEYNKGVYYFNWKKPTLP